MRCSRNGRRPSAEIGIARHRKSATSESGSPPPTCAVHQCRQLFEVLRTCRSNGPP
jgi:hypothetical protein